MDLTVREIMQTDVQTISPRKSLATLQKALIDADVSGLPVVDSGQLVGIASRSDIVQRLQSERVLAMRKIGLPPEIHLTSEDASDLGDVIGESLEKIRVEQIMKRDIVSIPPESPIQLAAELLTKNRIHRLPIVENDRLIGLVSSHDIVGLVANETFQRSSTDS
ncbi:CBS domain-containing protein [Planctomycetota bacterium]